jgi:hypothetical protein
MKHLTTKFLLFIFSLAALTYATGCTTTGAAENLIGPGHFEVRVWNGHVCQRDTPPAICKKHLQPMMDQRAKNLCHPNSFELSECHRKAAVSGDRFYCFVRCLNGSAKEPKENNIPAKEKDSVDGTDGDDD